MELEDFRIVRGWEYLTYHLEFDLRVEINKEGQDVRGDSMWRVGMWVSGQEDGSGKQIGYRHQVMAYNNKNTKSKTTPITTT